MLEKFIKSQYLFDIFLFSPSERSACPFRYPGQYEETGLYYNRFRYYSPHDWMYTQQDPIGLAGGNPTLYAFVGDPNAWIDLFGLNTLPSLPNRVLLKWEYKYSALLCRFS
ncbi:RHS repeat domain-containing protein [Paenibacillus oleatilyticus]|uniref:RHS repeat domain-containing protein n=1 Tax=Paenibacillus oleatilyticus TaxID=2594886 RepID=A0ABV4USH0_9BACL